MEAEEDMDVSGSTVPEAEPEKLEDDDIEMQSPEESDLSSTKSSSGSSLRGAAPCPPGSTAKNVLPAARIKSIMRAAPDSMSIGQDAVFAVSRATEYFISYLAKTTLENSATDHAFAYSDLANRVKADPSLKFLSDVIPRKVKARDYLASLQPQGGAP